MSKFFSFFRMHKKLILVLFFFFISCFFFLGGQIQSYAEDLGFGPALIDTGNCIVGSAPCNPDSAQEIHLFQPGANSTSAMEGVGRVIDNMYTNPPNSSIVWAYDQVQRIQNKELLAVYAQDANDSSFYFPGLGYNLLMPMMGLWQWSRNVVYVFYIVIIIVLSFLILFRQTLSGQAAVSIINSLPSLIISLVLVSLSYPIAGFFVDLIYIGSNVAQGLLISSESSPGYEFTDPDSRKLNLDGQTQSDVNYLQPDDPAISLWAIWGTSNTEIFECSGAGDEEECISNLLPSVEAGYLKYIGSIIKLGEDLAGGLLGKVSESGLLNLILGLTALMASFRLFMTLLKNYVLLTLSPLYLPWMFLMTAIPSKTKSSIINALKPLAAASLSFVAVYVLFLIMVIIGNSNSFSNAALQNVGEFQFTPPLLGYDDSILLEADSGITRTLIVYVLFLAAPTIPDMVSKMLNVQTSSQLAGQIGQTAQSGFGGLFSGISTVTRRATGGNKEKH